MRHKNNKGFTLLEVIIVIIIIAVLASLAIPRFQRTTLFARSQEAIRQLSTFREAMERYALFNSNAYTGATIGSLDVAEPVDADSSFDYVLAVTAGDAYTIVATCDFGACVAADIVQINQDGVLSGGGVFGSL